MYNPRFGKNRDAKMGNMSGNMTEYLLDITRYFKPDVATALETLISNFTIENPKVEKNIFSSLRSEMT